MSYVVSWRNLQSLVAATGGLARKTNVHLRYPCWYRRQFLSVVRVVQSEEAGQALQRRRLHKDAQAKPVYPPRTFCELLKWNYYALNVDPDDPLIKTYFNIELVSNDPLTYKFYTPAFEQYASPKNQKYVLAVVEQGTGSYGVKFVNEATVKDATSTYINIILEGEITPQKIMGSLYVKDKNSKKLYLSPNTTGPRGFMITSPNPASFGITFY